MLPFGCVGFSLVVYKFKASFRITDYKSSKQNLLKSLIHRNALSCVVYLSGSPRCVLLNVVVCEVIMFVQVFFFSFLLVLLILLKLGGPLQRLGSTTCNTTTLVSMHPSTRSDSLPLVISILDLLIASCNPWILKV